jgi:preprotein translocase subunit YajC
VLVSHALPVAVHLAASTGKKGGSSLLSFIPLLVIVGIGYLLLVRPARNRQRRALENRSALEPGVEVTTTAGLLATVVAVEDDVVTLEIAPGVNAKFVRGAIARVNTPAEAVEDIQPMHDDTLPTREDGPQSPEPHQPTTEIPPEPGPAGAGS